MANTKANAVVGKPAVSGGILVADIGATLPTDETTALTGFTAVGYLSDDGFTRSESPNTDVIKAWGGDTLVVITESVDYTAKFSFAEYLNPLTQQVIYGDDNVTVTAATSSAGNKLAVVGKGIASPHKVWVIQMFSGDAVGRLVFPDAQITDRDDVVYQDSDIAKRGVTLTLYPDAAGAYFYEYWDDGRLTA